MRLLEKPFNLRRFAWLSLGLLVLLWFEASLGTVFLSFLLVCLLAKEVSFFEWLGFTLMASLFLSLWFLASWVLVLVIFWAGAIFWFFTRRIKHACLFYSVLAWFSFVLMLGQPLMPSQLVWLVVGFIAVIIFKR